jgi:hypothetical protein
VSVLFVESVAVNTIFWNPVSEQVKEFLSIDNALIAQLSELEESRVEAVIVAVPKLLKETT